MGMDYGELDILRDNDNGKIYIVDANKTPGFNFDGCSESDKTIIIRRLTAAFKEAFISDAP